MGTNLVGGFCLGVSPRVSPPVIIGKCAYLIPNIAKLHEVSLNISVILQKKIANHNADTILKILESCKSCF